MNPAAAVRRLAGCVVGVVAITAPHAMAAAQTPDAGQRPGVRADRPDQRPAGVRPQANGRYRAPPSSSVPRLTQSFVLTRVEVEGSSLPPHDFAAAAAPFIGRTLDAPGLQALSDAVAAVYARSDIALYTVLIPTQTYAGGLLRVQVIEGFVQAAVVEGAVDAKIRRRLAAYAAPVVAEQPLRKQTLQRAISLMRDISGFTPDIGLQTGAEPGAVRLRIAGDAKPFQVAAGVNNRGTAFLGRTQGQVDLIANSVVTGGDQVRYTYAQPVGDALYRSHGLSYAAPLNNDGLSGQVSLGRLVTRPSAFPLEGESDTFGAQLSYPLVRDFERSIVVGGGIDGVNSDNAFLGFTFSSERTRALRLSASYTARTGRRISSAGATLSGGIDGLGARTYDAASARPDFRKLNLRLSDNRAVGRRFVLRTSLAAQWTPDRLPGAEMMAAGGDEFGRAYETAIIAGDVGYAAFGELGWQPETIPAALRGTELYGFVDGARLRYASRGGFPAAKSKLASVGGGARLVLLRRTSLQVEAVRGLNNPVTYENREVWRVIFSLRTLLS